MIQRSCSVTALAFALGLAFFPSPAAAAPQPGERASPASAARAAPPESPPAPISIELLETSPVALAEAPSFGDVDFSNDGAWVASDVTSGRLAWFNFNGNIFKSFFLGVDATNLYTAAGRGFFAGTDGSGTPMFGGYVTYGNFKKMSAPLPPNFLSQGGALAVSPNGYGVVISKAQSSLLWFQKDYSSPAMLLTVPGSARAIDFGPGGNWYIGVSNGIQVLTPSWSLVSLPNYTGNTTTVKGCGDKLWIGGSASGIDYLDWWESPGTDYLSAKFKRFFTTPYLVSSIDCGQNGTALAVGSNRTLFYVDPNAAVPVRGFQFSGTGGEFTKIKLGTGIVPRGWILDNQGILGNFELPADIRYASDNNSAPSRLFNLGLRNLF